MREAGRCRHAHRNGDPRSRRPRARVPPADRRAASLAPLNTPRDGEHLSVIATRPRARSASARSGVRHPMARSRCNRPGTPRGRELGKPTRQPTGAPRAIGRLARATGASQAWLGCRYGWDRRGQAGACQGSQHGLQHGLQNACGLPAGRRRRRGRRGEHGTAGSPIARGRHAPERAPRQARLASYLTADVFEFWLLGISPFELRPLEPMKSQSRGVVGRSGGAMLIPTPIQAAADSTHPRCRRGAGRAELRKRETRRTTKAIGISGLAPFVPRSRHE